MNEAQQNTLKLAAIIFALSCIFVPYRYGHNAYDITQNVSIGYYMIYETPRYKGNNDLLTRFGSSYIDFGRLIVTWIGIGIFFGLVYWERKEKKPPVGLITLSDSQKKEIQEKTDAINSFKLAIERHKTNGNQLMANVLSKRIQNMECEIKSITEQSSKQ